MPDDWEDDWETEAAPADADDWEKDEEENWDKEADEDWEQVNSKDLASEATPKSTSQDPGSPKSAVRDATSATKERLLPEKTDPDTKKINSFQDFEIKNFSDVDNLVNQFIKPKLFPTDPSTLTAKKAHGKLLNLAIDAKAGLMELKEMEKFQTQLANIVKAKKTEIVEAEKQAKKDQAEADKKAKEELEEAKKKEAEEKGETYVNDEDFFAGFE